MLFRSLLNAGTGVVTLASTGAITEPSGGVITAGSLDVSVREMEGEPLRLAGCQECVLSPHLKDNGLLGCFDGGTPFLELLGRVHRLYLPYGVDHSLVPSTETVRAGDSAGVTTNRAGASRMSPT